MKVPPLGFSKFYPPSSRKATGVRTVIYVIKSRKSYLCAAGRFAEGLGIENGCLSSEEAADGDGADYDAQQDADSQLDAD